MKAVVEIEQPITILMVVDTYSKREARALATQTLQGTTETAPEAVGNPVAEAPCIRRVRKLGV
ncbi:hypothetical protein PVT68_15675 [Microbulbifer bruguierae]|uniref:Uncharacterized protein n=1 Tax=Microbulbifer bruguierae TaxID=3029061 RepID=A0ABY8NBA2_9GAMM|nr:hypothetical protein [Microbulbifer bruguierae]WGL16199.1 hypothetical protein PVT68_15675 [Microbulbifer bruguierae]